MVISNCASSARDSRHRVRVARYAKGIGVECELAHLEPGISYGLAPALPARTASPHRSSRQRAERARRSSNCRMKDDDTHHCWVRHGRPEDGTLLDKNG